MSDTEVVYRFIVKHDPRLGPDEEPYLLQFYIGGHEHCYIEKKLIVAPHCKVDPIVEIRIPVPTGITPGTPFLKNDAALMVIQYVAAKSEDDTHKHKLGVNEAGTICFPLKAFDGLKGNIETTETFRSYNAIAANPAYDGDKGDLTLIMQQPSYPKNVSPFLEPDEYTIDHTKPFDNPLIRTAIESTFDFPNRSKPRFSSLAGLPCLPPYQFHQWVIPGQMLAAKRNIQPMDETWWNNLISKGIQRSFPNFSVDAAKMYLQHSASEDEKMIMLVNAWTIPCNYWRYYPDQTQNRNGSMVQMEAFGLTTRSKLGIVGGKMYTPLQDCEDDEEDIQKLAREFQSEHIAKFNDPFLKDLQKVSQKYVFLQALCGVNGDQVSSGTQVQKDPYANMGGHEVGVFMRKSTFVKLVGRVNTKRPLFKGWCEEYNPDLPFDATDRPMICEGTGTVDPSGAKWRLNSLEALRYVAGGEPQKTFDHMKFIEPQDPDAINMFYRAFISFTVPEMFDEGFSNISFTAMTFDKKGNLERHFSYNDLMKPHAGIGLHVDVGQSLEQAKMSKHLATFYPAVVGYNTPCALEQCPERTKIAKRMQKITETMKKQNRCASDKSKVIITDMFPTYYQLTKERIAALCATIEHKERIVDVTVTEEAISTALGGYRIAFHVDMSKSGPSLIKGNYQKNKRPNVLMRARK